VKNWEWLGHSLMQALPNLYLPILLLRRKISALTGDQHPVISTFHPDIEIAQMKGFGLAFGGQIDVDYSGDQRRILVNANVPGFAIRRVDLEFCPSDLLGRL
jgi:hypothetical protein